MVLRIKVLSFKKNFQNTRTVSNLEFIQSVLSKQTLQVLISWIWSEWYMYKIIIIIIIITITTTTTTIIIIIIIIIICI